MEILYKFNILFFCFGFIYITPMAAQTKKPAQSFEENYKKYLTLDYPIIDSLMMVHYKNGDYSKAIPLMQAGQDKAKNQFGTEDSTFAEYTANLSLFYQETGQHNLALRFNIQSKNIREKVLGKEHLSFASSLNNLAVLHHKMGNLSLALPFYVQALNIQEKILGIEDFQFAGSLNNLAALHKSMGNFDLALPLFIKSKNIREKVLGIEHPKFATSLNNLAELHKRMGNFDLALPLYIQAMDIRKKVLGIEHPQFVTSLNNLGGLYKRMGNLDLAIPLCTQALNIQEKILGIEHPRFAVLLQNLAQLHAERDNYDLALQLCTQALNIQKKALGPEHPHFALLLNNLAELHSDMGNFDLALPLSIQAVNIIKKVLGTEHPDFASSLNDLARLHQNMNYYDKAWNVLKLAVNSSSSTNIEHTFNQNWLDTLAQAPFSSYEQFNNILNSLAIIYAVLQKDSTIINPLAKQIIVVDLAMTLLNRARKQLANEKDKLRILSNSNKWMLKSLKVFNKEEHSHKAFLRADQNKSVLLLQSTKSQAAYRLGALPDSLIFKDKKLLKRQSQLQAKLVEKRPKAQKDSLRNELNHVNQDLNVFIKKIQKDYPKYHKLKYKQVDPSLEQIQEHLDDNTAFLEYVIADSILHIFFVDKTHVEWSKSFVTNKELKNRIKALHDALSNYEMIIKNKEKAYRVYSLQAHWFYQNLVEPALKNKKDIKHLIIVTDGELGHLPFETFLVEQAGQKGTDYDKLHYLVDDYSISYNYSATLWKKNKETPAPKNNGQILGIAANYNMKLDSTLVNVRLPTDQWLRNTLNPLPAARKEVETLQDNYQGFFAFDSLASEKTVKEKASDFAILHFATHGILDAKRSILSSLAFSEDNDSIESNFWQAHEISKIQLNADLVVLSACETGYGEFEAGNGIASLARAFMYAGASSLIVSLWQVNDYATSEIMKNLYANLASGMKKDEALRQAKIQYIKSAKGVFAHPAFWSPFIQMGNTRPVFIKTKGASPWLNGGFLIALIIGGGFLISRRKKKNEHSSK
jgi:CHAT domain-containing protein